MHQIPGQRVGACYWFRRPWSETCWWAPVHKRHLMGRRQLVRRTHQRLDEKGLRGWQLASDQDTIQLQGTGRWLWCWWLVRRDTLDWMSVFSWVVMQAIMGGCSSCITTRQAPWFWNSNCKLQTKFFKRVSYIFKTEHESIENVSKCLRVLSIVLWLRLGVKTLWEDNFVSCRVE